jgi:hypothetical protein
MTDRMDALQQAVAEDPALTKKLADLKDVDLVVVELAAVAKQRGIAVTEAEIRASFEPKSGGAPEPLEDEALDAIAGAGSPWCMFTKGCYCFFTK